MRNSMNLKSILSAGLWPFTPDPIQCGTFPVGEPQEAMPILLSGNSRHSVARIRCALGHRSAHLLIIDTHGLDWMSAIAAGLVTRDRLSTYLEQLLPPDAETRVVVPQPIFETLALSEWSEHPFWRFLPGPAEINDLPAFLDHSYELSAGRGEKKRFPFWKLQLLGAYGGLFLLLFLLPAALLGQTFLLPALLIALLALVGNGALMVFPSQPVWARVLAAWAAAGLCFGVTWWMGFRLIPSLWIALAGCLTFAWVNPWWAKLILNPMAQSIPRSRMRGHES
jgi:hypothetical protein